MSALGQKRTSEHVRVMSALPPKADIPESDWHVRFVPKADIAHRHPNAARCGRAQQRQAGCSSTDLIDRRCNAANKVT